MEPRYNEPLYNEVLGIKNIFLYPSNSKKYGKEPRYDETSLLQTHFASPLALHYIEVPPYLELKGGKNVFWDKKRVHRNLRNSLWILRCCGNSCSLPLAEGYFLMQPRGVQQVQLCSIIYHHHHYHSHHYVYYYFSLSLLIVCACLIIGVSLFFKVQEQSILLHYIT